MVVVCFERHRNCRLSAERISELGDEWSPVRDGHTQCSVMSPCLFNVCMDAVVREASASESRRSLLLIYVNVRSWQLGDLMLAGDTDLVADSEEQNCVGV